MHHKKLKRNTEMGFLIKLMKVISHISRNISLNAFINFWQISFYVVGSGLYRFAVGCFVHDLPKPQKDMLVTTGPMTKHYFVVVKCRCLREELYYLKTHTLL